MNIYGRASVSEFLGDNVVYRNLVPMAADLPTLGELRESTGLPVGVTPRKTTPAYAKVIAEIIKAARESQTPGIPLSRVIFIGDTRLNDSTAFRNICQAGDWQGWTFIGSEDQNPMLFDIHAVDVGAVVYANRWAALETFEETLTRQGFTIDEHTAVLLDLDKTTLGARGRNDKVIDQVRVEAAFSTARTLFGNHFDLDEFESAYHELNQVKYHPFTTDNQDYLVYICLMISAGIFHLDSLTAEIQTGQMADFNQFIQAVEALVDAMPANLKDVHQDFVDRIQQGDPTPLKAFRENEYRATVSRLGHMMPNSPVSELLTQEIVLTQEVRVLALKWRQQGALLFGLSDKPDEASIPSPALASQGYKPIHQVETSVVGALAGGDWDDQGDPWQLRGHTNWQFD